MTTGIKPGRLELIESLPEDWRDRIEQDTLDQGYDPMSIYPDEATIYNGPDDELAEVLAKYGWVK